MALRSSFRMAARAVGYRMGKSGSTDPAAFAELFQPEYVPDALLGYEKGRKFAWHKEKTRGEDRDTFFQSK